MRTVERLMRQAARSDGKQTNGDYGAVTRGNRRSRDASARLQQHAPGQCRLPSLQGQSTLPEPNTCQRRSSASACQGTLS